jgi:hypothetical protein
MDGFNSNILRKTKMTTMYFDVSTFYQINLQDSATYGMEMIIQLHNYVMFFNVFIISIVLWFFFEIFLFPFFCRGLIV